MENKKIITERTYFENAAEEFMLYKPVRISKELSEEFHYYLSTWLSSHFVDSWSATIYPLKKFNKFQRTNDYLKPF